MAIGGLENDMTAWTFLGMKPKITRAGLAKADPIVLAVVATNLDDESTRTGQFEGLGGC